MTERQRRRGREAGGGERERYSERGGQRQGKAEVANQVKRGRRRRPKETDKDQPMSGSIIPFPHSHENMRRHYFAFEGMRDRTSTPPTPNSCHLISTSNASGPVPGGSSVVHPRKRRLRGGSNAACFPQISKGLESANTQNRELRGPRGRFRFDIVKNMETSRGRNT